MGDIRRRLPVLGAAALLAVGGLAVTAAPATARTTTGPALAGTADTPAGSAPTVTGTQRLGPGVELANFSVRTATATVTGEVVTVDLRNPRASVGLLHPTAVGAREQVSSMTARQHAVAGVNADYFDIDESQHPGVAATGSSDGPEVTDGRALKAAVPDSQRFGPSMAPGTSTRDVIGVGVDRRARVGSLSLTGSVRVPGHSWALGGVNQYAVAQNSIAAFTSDWGAVSRQRVTCGSDAKRGDPCAADTAEVTVHRGRVATVSDTVGAGAIRAGDVVLVGREAGADNLRALRVGEPVSVRYGLTGSGVPYRFAVGGAPILRHGATLPGVDATVAATRTAAGVSADGRHLTLLALDGQTESGAGLTLAAEADVLAGFGASDGVNLDGGGSTTCAVRLPGSTTVTVVNAHPGGVAERAVANGIGVFVR